MAPKAQQPQREKITIPKLYEMKAAESPSAGSRAMTTPPRS
jgi:hypothetical protein